MIKRQIQVERKQAEITKAGSKVRVFVIPTNEELAIARETLALVKIVNELSCLKDRMEKYYILCVFMKMTVDKQKFT